MGYLQKRFAYPKRGAFANPNDYLCALLVFLLTFVGALIGAVVLTLAFIDSLFEHDSIDNYRTDNLVVPPRLIICHHVANAVDLLSVTSEIVSQDEGLPTSSSRNRLSANCFEHKIDSGALPVGHTAVYKVNWKCVADWRLQGSDEVVAQRTMVEDLLVERKISQYIFSFTYSEMNSFGHCMRSSLAAAGVHAGTRLLSKFAMGYTFRATLASNITHPLAIQKEVTFPLHIGLYSFHASSYWKCHNFPGELNYKVDEWPLGLKFNEVHLAGTAHSWRWKDTIGGRFGAPYADTQYVQITQNTALVGEVLNTSESKPEAPCDVMRRCFEGYRDSLFERGWREAEVFEELRTFNCTSVHFQDEPPALKILFEPAAASVSFKYMSAGLDEMVYVNKVTSSSVKYLTNLLSGSIVFGLISSLCFVKSNASEIQMKRFRFYVKALRLGKRDTGEPKSSSPEIELLPCDMLPGVR